MKNKDLISILTEEIDEEILAKMPSWFKILKESYKDRERKRSLLF